MHRRPGMIQMDVGQDNVGDIGRRNAEVAERVQPDLDAAGGARVENRGAGRGDQVPGGLPRTPAIPKVHDANVRGAIDGDHDRNLRHPGRATLSR